MLLTYALTITSVALWLLTLLLFGLHTFDSGSEALKVSLTKRFGPGGSYASRKAFPYYRVVFVVATLCTAATIIVGFS